MPWWVAFLVLTIAGELLELTRVLVLKKNARAIFFAITGIVLVGLLISLAAYDSGLRIAGFGLAALGM